MTKLNKNQVVRRYGKALFEVSCDQDNLVDIYNELLEIEKIFIENTTLSTCLSSKLLTNDQKKQLIKPLIDNASELINRFLNLLLEYSRIEYLKDIIDFFKDEYNKKSGIVNAKVTTVVDLDDNQIDKIKKILSKKLSVKKINLEQKCDPDIIGGVVIKANDMLIDGSIKTKLNMIKKILD